MIEFSGRISGSAEKHFWKANAKTGMFLWFTVLSLFWPLVAVLTVKMKSILPIVLYAVLFATVGLASWIPKSAKEKEKYVPRRIYIDGDRIISESNVNHMGQFLSDVKRVYDYGEFYFFVFPIGKISNDYICQKDLLSSGTLEEFEALIGDKLVRRIHE